MIVLLPETMRLPVTVRVPLTVVEPVTVSEPVTVVEPVTVLCDEEMDRGELPTMLLALTVVKTADDPEKVLVGPPTKLDAVIGKDELIGECT